MVGAQVVPLLHVLHRRQAVFARNPHSVVDSVVDLEMADAKPRTAYERRDGACTTVHQIIRGGERVHAVFGASKTIVRQHHFFIGSVANHDGIQFAVVQQPFDLVGRHSRQD